MTQFITLWFFSLATMLALDGIWLSLMVKRFYAPLFGSFMTSSPQIIPIVIFYLMYTLGLTWLVLFPGIVQHSSLSLLFFNGLVFGLVTYGTYDLTNQATIRDWSVLITLVDMAWGALLSGLVAVIVSAISNYKA